MSKTNGGPAFPCDRIPAGDLVVSSDGMTLRDYFAAKALQIVPQQTSYNMRANEKIEDYMARRAHEFADAMLKARGQ